MSITNTNTYNFLKLGRGIISQITVKPRCLGVVTKLGNYTSLMDMQTISPSTMKQLIGVEQI